MPSDLISHVALVSESAAVGLDSLAIVAAALQKQVTRDFGPIWGITATVDSFAKLEDVPVDYWKVMIMDDIQQQGAAGIHLDDQGQPFALVTAANTQDGWSITASHECLEMLVDPFGKRLVAGDSPKPDQTRVQFLVEVSDPSEAAQYGYSVNGVLVSDFYTPHFFDPVAVGGVQYSFTGAITEPRQVLQGGYLSWMDSATNIWWQERWFDGSEPEFVNLGTLSGMGSFRSQIDQKTMKHSLAAVGAGRMFAAAAGQPVKAIEPTSAARAAALQKVIADLLHPSGGAAALKSAKGPVSPRVRRAPRVKKDQ